MLEKLLDLIIPGRAKKKRAEEARVRNERLEKKRRLEADMRARHIREITDRQARTSYSTHQRINAAETAAAERRARDAESRRSSYQADDSIISAPSRSCSGFDSPSSWGSSSCDTSSSSSCDGGGGGCD